MRTIEEIRSEIRASFVANPTIVSVYGLDTTKTFTEQFSNVSIESALIDVVAIAAFYLESLFYLLKAETDKSIEEKMPHTLRWYRNKALGFRYGYALIPDSDEYSDIGLTEAQILDSQIITHASAQETPDSTGALVVRIKAVKGEATNLQPLTATERTALQGYFAELKDAGVKLLVQSLPPDSFRATVDVWVNPLLLDSGGLSLILGTEPVREAINSYLQNLPFNGEFSIMSLTDEIQKVEGVKVVQVKSTESRYGSLPFTVIQDKRVPDAGYMRLDAATDLTINYYVYA